MRKEPNRNVCIVLNKNKISATLITHHTLRVDRLVLKRANIACPCRRSSRRRALLRRPLQLLPMTDKVVGDVAHSNDLPSALRVIDLTVAGLEGDTIGCTNRLQQGTDEIATALNQNRHNKHTV